MRTVFKKMLRDPIAVVCMGIMCLIILAGIFAPLVAPNDPEAVDVILKYAGPSAQFPLGNDYLGRCTLSRLIYGIRTSVLLVLVTMAANVGIGLVLGLIAGYFRGMVDEILMRICDIMLSFPTQAMVLAIVGILGVGLDKILLAVIFFQWPWYARVFRTSIMKYSDKNYVQYSKACGFSTPHILFRNVLPAAIPEIVVIGSNNICSLILNVSGYSFLGLGVQAPKAEWGMMLNETRTVMLTHPEQMMAPGIAIMIVCVCCSFLGDSLRDAMDAKHVVIRRRRRAGRKAVVS